MKEEIAGEINGLESPNPETTPAVLTKRQEIRKKELFLSLTLLLATFFTTLIAGFSLDYAFRHAGHAGPLEVFPGLSSLLRHPARLFGGLSFSLTLLTILSTHELGHYLACRYYGIDSTLPFFIPFPSIIGTLGAFIRIRSPFVNRRALFDVGIAGPLAGFAFILPALILGFRASQLITLDSTGGLYFGEPLLFKLAAQLFIPDHGTHQTINLHPVGWAAWFGLLATSLNLLPIGQLDGGHVTYALFGPKLHRIISLGMILMLIPLGLLAWRTPSYLFFGVILLLLGLRHPRTLNNEEPIGKGRFYIGAIALLIFVLSFVPIPVTIK